MSMSPADARYHLARIVGLIRRGLASLRTRGWRATLQRVGVRLRRPPPPRREPLYAPAAAAFAPFAVPASAQPVASIVIPVYNHAAHTLACLRALAAHPPAAACEILVIDDGSSDDTAAWMAAIDGLRHHRRAHNGGFIAACNDGLRLARGQYVVLLNNDTVPQPGWLDALLDTFAQVPEAGLVGAQLLYPDGRLQESGGIVFDDGSCWSYGRFESAEDPRYASLRDADYCSGAALAIPRALFEQLGGLDARYAPAYYEDTDLAFKVRAAGRRVLVQPASRVVHDEGTSNGTDTGSGIKAWQVRNQQVFADAWRAALARQLPAGSVPGPALVHRGQRQVLIIDESVPRPDRDSASLRQFNLIRMLLAGGAHVVFLPTRGEHGGAATQALQVLGVEVWHAPWLQGVGSWLRTHGPRFQVAMLVRHHVATECLPLLRRHAPQARTVFDTVDLHYLRERRGAELSGDPRLARGAERTRASELAVMAATDVTLLVSAAEKQQLAVDAPSVRVELLSNLHEVAGRGLDWAQRQGLVFVGGFNHPPNLDAMQWFIGEVFPLIRQRLPGIRFHCIGADVPDSLRALAATQPGVQVHGYVPDVVPWMAGGRVAVAPLRFGAGVKGKINLSMAHGQPVVATHCAAEGMHLHDGEDVLVADDARAFADAVVRLHDDEALWRRLSGNGLDNIARHFSMDAAREVVARVFLS
ncbi:MAG: glycosyl transferase [Lysobacteraceae bacterium SCN 69-123]|uniref:glycosyltransferase n=1 Tax=Stenotrophomonas acidaminiphila TaxID=128780 RepID=UPI00086BCC7D|nr:glycosyltransferase [Stenotrophomonas acidaminiphila]MDF9443396.1 glycosyltransferase [Stenotrophomonas acidaminiphila]ODU47249.1 MAG: glycosyl transferase [Xanthomonadaceae bacterium SCN 69-123]